MTVMQFLSQFGDLLSGVSGALTLWLLFQTTRKLLPNEMGKFRAQKREEIAAMAAREVWQALFRFTLAMQAICDPFVIGPAKKPKTVVDDDPDPKREYLESIGPRRRELAEASNGFLSAWGLAEIYFSNDAHETFQAIWKLRARVVTAIEMHGMFLDGSTTNNDENWEIIYGKQTRADIESLHEKLKAQIVPIALVQGPLPDPPATFGR